MQVYKCNRCLKEIKVRVAAGRKIIVGEVLYRDGHPVVTGDIDLCEECDDKLTSFLGGRALAIGSEIPE